MISRATSFKTISLTGNYLDLLEDYYKDPDKYSSYPVLYNGNDLGLEDRESYFDVTEKEPYSEPETISLKAGESINISASSGSHFSVDLLIAMLEPWAVVPEEGLAGFSSGTKDAKKDNSVAASSTSQEASLAEVAEDEPEPKLAENTLKVATKKKVSVKFKKLKKKDVVKIKVSAAGNGRYLPGEKDVTVKIRVK